MERMGFVYSDFHDRQNEHKWIKLIHKALNVYSKDFMKIDDVDPTHRDDFIAILVHLYSVEGLIEKVLAENNYKGYSK